MDPKTLDELKNWFIRYVRGFKDADEYIRANLRYKHGHSWRTCRDMAVLAADLGLSDSQEVLAKAVGLLHDVGRFEQFMTYRTYDDSQSVDHGVFGVEVLNRAGVLDRLDRAEREVLETAIRVHSLKELPDGLTGEVLRFARMIRDADKLDIYRFIARTLEAARPDPALRDIGLRFPDEPVCTPEVLEALVQGQRIAFGQLRTLSDLRCMVLGWVFDVNFPSTLRLIRADRCLEILARTLPKDPAVQRAVQVVFDHVAGRIGQQVLADPGLPGHTEYRGRDVS